MLLKRRLWNRCFPVNFAKFLRTSFCTELLWRLDGNDSQNKLSFVNYFHKKLFFKKKVPPRRRFGVFIADLKHISFLYQLFLWLL